MAGNLIRLRVPAHRRRAALAARKASIAPDIAAALAADRIRTTDLLRVASQADRLGVKFDIAKAIKSGVTANEARAFVLAHVKPGKRRRLRGRVDIAEPLPADYASMPADFYR